MQEKQKRADTAHAFGEKNRGFVQLRAGKLLLKDGLKLREGPRFGEGGPCGEVVTVAPGAYVI